LGRTGNGDVEAVCQNFGGPTNPVAGTKGVPPIRTRDFIAISPIL
jgi:hypothetical protein